MDMVFAYKLKQLCEWSLGLWLQI